MTLLTPVYDEDIQRASKHVSENAGKRINARYNRHQRHFFHVPNTKINNLNARVNVLFV